MTVEPNRDVSTERLRSSIVGLRFPPDDPAEQFHECSRWYPSLHPRETWGTRQLDVDPTLQAQVQRSGKRAHHLPFVPLPDPKLPEVSLAAAIRARKSISEFSGDPIALVQASTLLHCAYGRLESHRRVVPSAGGLYSLELFLLALRVDDLPQGAYRYETLEHGLERLPAVPGRSVRSAFVVPTDADRAAALLVLAGVFWRARFKYGTRGYRFVLLEAGHAAQNVLLAASTLELGAVPFGGFYDRPLDEIVMLDSVHESVLYAVLVGRADADVGSECLLA
jgi:SagB-type dehydrogenase family enzyme